MFSFISFSFHLCSSSNIQSTSDDWKELYCKISVQIVFHHFFPSSFFFRGFKRFLKIYVNWYMKKIQIMDLKLYRMKRTKHKACSSHIWLLISWVPGVLDTEKWEEFKWIQFVSLFSTTKKFFNQNQIFCTKLFLPWSK